MGFCNVTVFDDDKVEIENMSSQFFRFKDIGKNKAVALADLIYEFTNVKIEAIAKRYEGGTLPGIVISAVDSMKSRTLIWDQHVGMAPATRMIIDPRMAAETALMYVMNPMDERDDVSYRKTLYTDDNAVQERCTGKATVYTALSISAMVAKAVKDIVTNSEYPRILMWSIKECDFKAYRSVK
jgi:molybdopterin/thiamine biosynthesis adenylyltransferase